MKATSCDREIEVLGAIQSGHWLEASDPDLRAHAAGCPVCAEVALVACALLEADVWSGAEIHPLPQASLVWWKAQLRARREAVERASEPIAIFERVAYAFGCLALLGMAIWQRDRIEGWLGGLGWFSGIPHQTYVRGQEFLATGSLLTRWVPEWTSIFALAAGLLVITFALSLALAEE
ncbi:MAG: hypothetical protein ACRD2G_07495 [Terriglobia bacterium]